MSLLNQRTGFLAAAVASLATAAGAGAWPSAAVPLASDPLSFPELVVSLQRLLGVIMGLGALVSLTFTVYNLISGKSEAAKRLVWVFLALFIGYFLMTWVARQASVSFESSGQGFAGIKSQLKTVINGAVCVVAMISVTSLTIKMAQGDEQSYRRLFVWVVALTIGSAIIQVL